MPGKPLERWLLVNYSGYPFTPSSLIPDNGLANLAGALIDEGRQARIMDLATVSILSSLTPPRLARRLAETWRIACAPGERGPGAWARARILLGLQRGEWVRRRRQRHVLAEIGEKLVTRIQRDRIDAVGFKLWNGDGIEGSAVLARTVRTRCPGVRVFGGGPQVDVFMERILAHLDVFDALAYGEAEDTIRDLAREGGDASTYAHIPNLIFRNGSGEVRTPARIVDNLDDLPMPIYDPEVYPAMEGQEKIKIIVIDESRGCRNNCAFCIHPVKSNHNLRMKSVSRLVCEVEALRARSGIHTFRFAGSCTPCSLLVDFAKQLCARRDETPASPARPFLYSSFAHVREAAATEFRDLHDSGCAALFFGMESGSQEVLKAMHKGIRVDDLARTIGAANAAGIQTIASLIFPAPSESPRTEDETIAVLEAARPTGVTVTPPIVMPRTSWFETPERYGIDIPDKEAYLTESFYWKVKFLMPPSFWKKLPVSINGKSHARILREAARFSKRVEALGIDTAITDESCLMSRRAGMTTKAFRDASRLAFFAGDAERAGELVRRINERA